MCTDREFLSFSWAFHAGEVLVCPCADGAAAACTAHSHMLGMTLPQPFTRPAAGKSLASKRTMTLQLMALPTSRRYSGGNLSKCWILGSGTVDPPAKNLRTLGSGTVSTEIECSGFKIIDFPRPPEMFSIVMRPLWLVLRRAGLPPV